jgi:Icc-related predicted phosphoesterase
MRLYVVSDFHASERAWRKMLNAIRLNVYRADAVLYAGDLTGKAMVPIVETSSGWDVEFMDQKRHPRSEAELEAVEREITDFGFYALRVTQSDVSDIAGDKERLDALFRDHIRRQVSAWLELATERLADTDVPLVFIPGNDDPHDIDDLLDSSERAVNADGRLIDLPGGLQVLGLGKSSPTPWHTPREVDETAFHESISNLLDEAKDPKRTILLIHCPPFDSGLDTAPLLDDTLRPRSVAGQPLSGPVGSVGVRSAIERFQPLAGVHGHIHESPGERRIGSTVCVNPGSDAILGVVRGLLVDVEDGAIQRVVRVEG